MVVSSEDEESEDSDKDHLILSPSGGKASVWCHVDCIEQVEQSTWESISDV